MSLKLEATEPRSVIDIEAGIYQATVESIEPADGMFGEQFRASGGRLSTFGPGCACTVH